MGEQKHECPPDRVAMLARLEEIQSSYNERLANQRQVIENLSDARKAALQSVQNYKDLLEDLLNHPSLTPVELGHYREAFALLSREVS